MQLKKRVIVQNSDWRQKYSLFCHVTQTLKQKWLNRISLRNFVFKKDTYFQKHHS